MQYEINNSDWTQISKAGENVSIWLDEQRDGTSGFVDCRIICSVEKPTIAQITEAKRIYRPNTSHAEIFSPKPYRASFWAIMANVGDKATIQVSPAGYGGTVVSDSVKQDVTTPLVPTFLATELGNVVTTGEATIDTNTVSLPTGHGFIVGDVLVVKGKYMGRVMISEANLVTLNHRFNMTYPSGTTVYRGQTSMKQDGSVTPIIFRLESAPGIIFDIYTLKIVFTWPSALSDTDMTKFAGLAALTKGFILRTKLSSIRYNNILSARSNADMLAKGEIITMTKAPAGSYGMTLEIDFEQKYGAAIRLDGDVGEQLQAIVQDNLSGLTTMESSVTGHLAEAY